VPWTGAERRLCPAAKTEPRSTIRGVIRPPRQLAGDLIVRTAVPGDVDAILALQMVAFGDAEGPGIRTYLEGPHGDVSNWSVVQDGDQVVSSCTLLPLPLAIDDVRFDAGQIEMVATAPGHQRRGLVRAQFDWHHERSSELGHLAQFVAGIPYFYRRFGYGYGVSYADLFVFDRERLDPPDDITIRYATSDDIADLAALEQFRSGEGLRLVRQDHHWRHWIDMAWTVVADGKQAGIERFFVVEQDGAVVGWSGHSIEDDNRRLLLLPAVTRDASVADAVIAHALDEAGDRYQVVGHDTPGTEFGRRVREVGSPFPYGLGIYVRIADPIAFLQAIEPVLSRRLAGSRFADVRGQVDISLYNAGIAIDYDGGKVTAIRAIPGVEDPFDSSECGVAPDWFPALALGRFGARELEQRVDDVSLGRHAELLEVLFPRIDTDICGDI